MEITNNRNEILKHNKKTTRKDKLAKQAIRLNYI
jgi:hypothetical protein